MKHSKNSRARIFPTALETIREIIRDAMALFRPPPTLSVSEWADKYRCLSEESSAEPGQWYTERAEYQRGIMDAFSDPEIEDVCVMSSAQVGKTEILNNVVGYFIHQDPCPILVVEPTIEMAETWSKDRLAPMLRDTPALAGKVNDPRSRDSGNTLRAKEFRGGRVSIAGANSPASLASRPVRVVLQDEIDRFPASAGTEGSPRKLADKRANNYWNRKRGKFSTPTVKGVSAIEAEFEESDQRRYHVPCPYCGVLQTLKWGQSDKRLKLGGMKWEKDEKGKPRNIRYECEGCGAALYEKDKYRMIRNGQWIAGKPENKGRAGFHINELYSPWSSWKKIVKEFLEAHKKPETLKVWINTTLGETWEEEGVQADDGSLMARREEYGPELPEGVVLLTAGVDVQDDRIRVKVKGWGEDEESWLVEWIDILGAPATDKKVWDDLDEILLRTWTHPKAMALKIAAACVDSGGHATKQVYDFCRKRENRRVWAIKGMGGAGLPVIKLPPRKARKGGKIVLGLVGVDTCKGLVYDRLKLEEFGPGYMHFPMRPEIDEEYFKQLTAEKIVTKFVRGFAAKVWVKTRARNEALDCEAYNIAALASLNANLKQIAAKIKAQPKKDPPRDPAPEKAAAIRPIDRITEGTAARPLPRPPRGGGFVNRW